MNVADLAVRRRDLMDHIFVDLHVVAALGERVELEAKLVLRGRDFVVVLLGLRCPCRP
jgi:hypothetical protein